MDSYYSVVFALMASIGLQIKLTNKGKAFNFRKAITIAVPLMTVFHETATLVSNAPSLHKVYEFPCLCLVLEDVVSMFTLLWNRQKISNIISFLEKLCQDMTPDDKRKYEKVLTRSKRIATGYGVMAMSATYIFNLLPMGRMIYSKYINGVSISLSPFYFWFPFKKENYFVATYIYEAYCAHTNVMLMLTSLQLFILIVTQLAISFECLGKDITRIINSCEQKEFPKKLLKQKVKEIVQRHSELIEYSDNVSNLFCIIAFFSISIGCVIICFTGFAIAVIHTFCYKKLSQKLIY